MAKRLWTENATGPRIEVISATDERTEASAIVARLRAWKARGGAWRDCAVLYRLHVLSQALEDALLGASIPYDLAGGHRFYDRAEIKDLLAYLRLTVRPDDLAVLRTLNTPARGLGDVTAQKLATYGHDRGVPLWDLLGRCDYPPGLGSRTRTSLAQYHALVCRMQEQAATPSSLHAIAVAVLHLTGLIPAFRGTPEGEDRIGRLSLIIEALRHYGDEHPRHTLRDYLDSATLADASVPDPGKPGDPPDRVTLSTVHAAKGLEWPLVCVIGLEEGIFPSHADDPEDEVDEERRLAYVAMTRARQRLVLSHVGWRRMYGKTSVAKRSRFIGEIPARLCRFVGAGEPAD